MAEAVAFPETPKKAQFPLCFEKHESFVGVIDKSSKIIQALSSQQLKQLSTCMQTVLYPGMPEGTAPAIPSSSKTLMKHVEKYCNPLNISPLKMLSKHLKNDVLTQQLEEYERTLSDQLKQATWDTEVDVRPPPAYTTILVKLKKADNTTVREAVQVRDILAENLVFKGDHGILHLAGLANDSLVFFVAEGNIGPMIQRMQHEKDRMLATNVEWVTFAKLAKLDVASGNIAPGPNVPKRDPAEECAVFGVLLIGETGSGKSALINNLLGAEVASEGHKCRSETDTITEYRGTVAGVPVALYDTPGTDETAATDRDICREIKRLIKSKKVCLVIFCFSMNEQRIKRSHISTMRAYHEATVNWKNAIVALTFSDKIKAPRTERNSEGFNEAEYFRLKIEEWKATLRDTLVKKVGVPQSVAENLIMRPTTDEWDATLPDNQKWFVPLWLDILDLLAPAAYFRFLQIHQDTITFEGDTPVTRERDGGIKIHLTSTDLTRFKTIAKEKLAGFNPRSVVGGMGGTVLVLGGAGAVISVILGAAGLTICGIGAVGIIIGVVIIVGAVAYAVHPHGQSENEKSE